MTGGGPTTTPVAADGHTFRTDIEALRALAVTLVLLFHAFPGDLTGGFVGVDVFFVISGYLIITHLASQAGGGRLDLVRFWVRRAWRLLPMAFLVLAATLAGTVALAPRSLWGATVDEVLASAFYVQNWYLYAQASDYTAADSGATPVQHYWSLSIEEQLYVAAPLAVLALAAVVGRSRVRRATTWLLLGVAALSFGFSAGWEPAISGQAYYNSLTRLWEFALGGFVGVARVRLRGGAASGTFWAGTAAVVAASVVLDDSFRFPGWVAAVPALGAAAALAGGRDLAWGRRLIEWRPVQELGGLSYGIYLWHWPILVIAPHAVGRSLSSVESLGALVAAVVLAWLSRPGEQRLRALGRGELRGRPVLMTVSALLVVGAAFVGGGQLVHRSIPGAEETAEQIAESRRTTGGCFGAAALMHDGCDEAGTSVVPDPATVSGNNPEERCKESLGGREVRTCDFGPADGTRVALVGDSHAQRLLPALKPLAEEHGWRVTTYLKASCPFTAARPVKYQSSCVEWNAAVIEALQSDPPEVVVTMSSAGLQYEKQGGVTDVQAGADGMLEHVEDLKQRDIEVVAVVDNPQPGFAGIDPAACVLREGPTGCTFPADRALRPDSATLAAQRSSDLALLDLTDLFCRDGTCRSVIGGVLVYRDGQHVIDVYAESAAPFLGERLVRLAPRLG